MMKKKYIHALLVAASLSASLPAQANLQAALNGMFSGSTSNLTPSSALQSASRGGMTFGSVVLRNPSSPVNILTLDPPRFSAGCGGIDMYGGSFTFINAAAFTQALRNMMNQAQGLLFQAALGMISPNISQLLSQFQKITQDMNSLASNTCALATVAINKIDPGALETQATQAAATIGSQTGAITDDFNTLHWASPQQGQNNQQNVQAANPKSGNFTWKALSRSNAAASLAVAGMIDPNDPQGDKARLFLMSLLGTSVNSTANPAAGSTAPSQSTNYGPLFRLHDLLSAKSLLTYDCGTIITPPPNPNPNNYPADTTPYGHDSCTDLANGGTYSAPGSKFVPLDFAGALPFVQNMLYGDDTQTQASGIQAALASNTPDNPGQNSIYYKVFYCKTAGCNMTAAEQEFMTLAAPIIGYIKESQYDIEQLTGLTTKLQTPLSYLILEQIGEATVRAAQGAWTGVVGVTMPSSVADSIAQLSADMNEINTLMAKSNDDLEAAKKIAKEIREAFPRN